MSLDEIESYFESVFRIKAASEMERGSIITERFFRDNDSDIAAYGHVSNTALVDVLFCNNGNVFNRIIPAIWKSFIQKSAKDIAGTPFGKISQNGDMIHPNAMLTPLEQQREIWQITFPVHYHEFRRHHITSKAISSECREFLELLLPEIVFTRKAQASYEKLGVNDKKTVLSDLLELNAFVTSKWSAGPFPVEDFCKSTGVDASDESTQTKTNPKLKELRKFSIPEIGSVYSFLHIKISNTYRVYFYPDPNSKKCYITYIGKHLKTARF